MDEVEMNYRGTEKEKKKQVGEKKEEKAQGGRFTEKFPASCKSGRRR